MSWVLPRRHLKVSSAVLAKIRFEADLPSCSEELGSLTAIGLTTVRPKKSSAMTSAFVTCCRAIFPFLCNEPPPHGSHHVLTWQRCKPLSAVPPQRSRSLWFLSSARFQHPSGRSDLSVEFDMRDSPPAPPAASQRTWKQQYHLLSSLRNAQTHRSV